MIKIKIWSQHGLAREEEVVTGDQEVGEETVWRLGVGVPGTGPER